MAQKAPRRSNQARSTTHSPDMRFQDFWHHHVTTETLSIERESGIIYVEAEVSNEFDRHPSGDDDHASGDGTALLKIRYRYGSVDENGLTLELPFDALDAVPELLISVIRAARANGTVPPAR